MRICRVNCIFLQPTEINQTDNKEAHVCRLFRKRVKHCGLHPLLVAIESCLFAKPIKKGE